MLTRLIRCARCCERRTVGVVASSRLPGVAFGASVLAIALVAASCAESGTPNQLERIDGPAQVDPDFGGLGDGTLVEVDGGSIESEPGG